MSKEAEYETVAFDDNEKKSGQLAALFLLNAKRVARVSYRGELKISNE